MSSAGLPSNSAAGDATRVEHWRFLLNMGAILAGLTFVLFILYLVLDSALACFSDSGGPCSPPSPAVPIVVIATFGIGLQLLIVGARRGGRGPLLALAVVGTAFIAWSGLAAVRLAGGHFSDLTSFELATFGPFALADFLGYLPAAVLLVAGTGLALLAGAASRAGAPRAIPIAGLVAGLAAVSFSAIPAAPLDSLPTPPAVPAAQIQTVTINGTSLSVEPAVLTSAPVDLELQWADYAGSDDRLTLVGPLQPTEEARLRQGDIDWLQDYFDGTKAGPVTAQEWGVFSVGPGALNPNGYLGRLTLSAGRYAWLAQRSMPAPSGEGGNIGFTLRAWTVFSVH